MPLLNEATQSKASSWPMTVGAEGIAVAQFARCGFDVLVQSGHDKPWYDLVVTKAGNLLKVSVKPSEDGTWSLTQSYLRRAAELSGKRSDCHGAIDLWLDNHGSRTVCCLVQFAGVAIDQLPRIYLASPAEIAQRMRDTADRLGHSTLYERYEWASSESSSKTAETLPENWRFSHGRIQELLNRESAEVFAVPTKFARNHSPSRVWPVSADATRKIPMEVALTA